MNQETCALSYCGKDRDHWVHRPRAIPGHHVYVGPDRNVQEEVISPEGIRGSEAYAGIAAEIYDTKGDLGDFLPAVLRAAVAYAAANGLPFPPNPKGT